MRAAPARLRAKRVPGSGAGVAFICKSSRLRESRLAFPIWVQRTQTSDPFSQLRPVIVADWKDRLAASSPLSTPEPELFGELKSSGEREVQVPVFRLVALVL